MQSASHEGSLIEKRPGGKHLVERICMVPFIETGSPMTSTYPGWRTVPLDGDCGLPGLCSGCSTNQFPA